MHNYNVLVFGGNHHNTLGVLRSLGRRGIRPDLLLVDPDRQGYVAKSRYINELYVCETYPNALDWLKEGYRHKGEKTVVICTSDHAICIIDENSHSLSSRYVLPGSILHGQISKYMDKQLMAKLAVEVGLRVPHSYNAEGGVLPKEVGLPCIVKPLRSVEGTKGDIVVCYNKSDVERYNAGRTPNADIQVQDYIEKDYEYQLIGCSINSGETVIIPGVSKIISAAEGSNTGFLKYEQLDRSYPIKECKAFIQRIGYSGLFSIEFIRDRSGVDYFMEMNFRNDGNAICVTKAGVNLPYIWYLSGIGRPYDGEIKAILPVYVMPEFDEMLRIPKHKLTFSTWVKEMIKADAYMEFDIKDQFPFWNRIGFYVKLIVRKALSKIK